MAVQEDRQRLFEIMRLAVYSEGCTTASESHDLDYAHDMLDEFFAAHNTKVLESAFEDQSKVYDAAKAGWDRFERGYWDSNPDMRPFDPSITELDGDDCDRGREWLEIASEVISDFRSIVLVDAEAKS